MSRWPVATLVLALVAAAPLPPARAQETFATYGMPKEAVWGPVIEAFCKRQGCTHVDTDMGSGEAITKFVAERGKPVAYATEAGMTFARVAVERGAALAYRPAAWDKIPDWAKDPDGHWFAVYAGVPTMLVNPARVKAVPTRWSDLLKPEYQKTLGIKDPRTSGTALATVLAANAAMGGTLANLAPGVQYFRKLKEAGTLSPVRVSDSNIQKGEIPVTVKYDHENLVLRDALQKEVRLEIVVPADGTMYTPSVLILNRYAPKPELAKAFADFVASDEGQLLIARAYPRPIRYIAGNLAVPADVKARWLPDDQYAGRIRNVSDWDRFSMPEFVRLWTTEVAP
ncbi:MAG TPA: extracellular solute-binding protein [Methylomirabilota bacterium]|jgi:putative spermidine/putrescine transport system substrate-binding protein|nr:extracellular solute-binding protein [Methylomirabilota bacterium]